jgi:uncharacterized membrane protein YtjA (UPF0391 family)
VVAPRTGRITKRRGAEPGSTTPATATPPVLQLFSGQFRELAVLFVVLALLSWAVGARGPAGLSMTVARWFIVISLVLAVVSLVL